MLALVVAIDVLPPKVSPGNIENVLPPLEIEIAEVIKLNIINPYWKFCVTPVIFVSASERAEWRWGWSIRTF